MKKIICFFCSIVFLFQVSAKEVNIDQARKVAEDFLLNMSGFRLKSTSSVKIYDVGDIFKYGNNILKSTTNENRDIFAFNIGNDEGFILISGDDAAPPILAYSMEGSISADNIPPNTFEWLNSYRTYIQYLQDNNIQQSETVKAAWDGTENNVEVANPIVSPLISTKWGQGTYYNAKCPYDDEAQNFVWTGCVATAMAQVMNYWEYPAKGTGFHTDNNFNNGALSGKFGMTYYDWDLMPDIVNEPNSAVATLLYQCGVAADMVYSVEASGAFLDERLFFQEKGVSSAEIAFWKYFGYEPSVRYEESNEYSIEEWKSLLKSELDANRPMIYEGNKEGGSGHAFVCDGYSEDDYFHFNWGWRGSYDGYFLMDALNPGTQNYSSDQAVLLGIVPSENNSGYKLELTDNLQVENSSIAYGDVFSVSAEIENNGSELFQGDICAAIFDDQNTFIDSLQVKQDLTIASGESSGLLTFTSERLTDLFPGSYTVNILFCQDGGDWDFVNASETNTDIIDSAVLTVEYENQISLGTQIEVETPKVYMSDTLKLNFNVTNNSDTDFSGSLKLSLYDIHGEFVTNLFEKLDVEIQVNSTNTDDFSFFTEQLNVKPGEYSMVLFHKVDEGDYELTGAGMYDNPAKIIVLAHEAELDQYEDNNTIYEAYQLPVEFIDDKAYVNTEGSTFLLSDAYDYFSIYFADGYDYDIDIALNDYYNSVDGNAYSIGAAFVYSLNGVSQSDTLLSGVVNSFSATGENMLFVGVGNIYPNDGTYLLELNITRSVTTDIPELTDNPELIVSPNPCVNDLNIQCGENLKSYAIYNAKGSVLRSGVFGSNSSVINVSSLPKGIYFLTVKTEENIFTEKVVKE